jgi:hypothetical protein
MAAARYGHAHRQLREAWRPRVEAGQVACCCGCGWRIEPGQAWDLAHDPMDAVMGGNRYLGPQIAGHNRSTAREKRLRGRHRGGFRWVNPAW